MIIGKPLGDILLAVVMLLHVAAIFGPFVSYYMYFLSESSVPCKTKITSEGERFRGVFDTGYFFFQLSLNNRSN